MTAESANVADDFDLLSHPLTVSTEYDSKSRRRSQILEDGRKILTYENGEELTEHEDGTLEQSTLDGSRIEVKTDGTKTETTKDGIIVTTDAKSGRLLKQETPDGIIIEFKEDGTKIEYFPNGSVITTYKDGSITEINDNHEITRAIDGTVTEVDFRNRTKIITYNNGTKKQIDLDDNTEILEDKEGNLLQINPDGSKTCTGTDGRETNILTDGTIIIEKDGVLFQKDSDGSIVQEDGKRIDPNSVNIRLEALFQQALESTFEEKYLPHVIDQSKIKEEPVDIEEDLIQPKPIHNGKNYTQEDFMIGLARVYPSSCTFSTNRYGLHKITAGALMERLNNNDIISAGGRRRLPNKGHK